MSLLNLAANLCVVKVQNQLGRPSKEVVAAAAVPALANTALLLAQGSPGLYVRAITRLYQANNLPCPDLGLIAELQDEFVITNEQVTVGCDIHTNVTEWVPLETNISAPQLEEEAEFQLENITGTCIVAIAPPPPVVETSDEYSESQQLCDMLKLIDNMATVTHQMDDILHNVEEVPATLNEVEDILNGFDTIKTFSSNFSINDHPNISESSAFEGIDANKTAFNSDFYNMTRNLSFTKDTTREQSCEWDDTFVDNSCHFGSTQNFGNNKALFASTKVLEAELPPRFSSTKLLDTVVPPRFSSTKMLDADLPPRFSSTKKFDSNLLPMKSTLKKSVTLLPPAYNSTPTEVRVRSLIQKGRSSQLYNIPPVNRSISTSLSRSKICDLQATYTASDLTRALGATLDSNSKLTSMSNTGHCSRQQISYNPSSLDILQYLQ